MKKIYVAILFLILSQLTIAQNHKLEWAKQIRGTYNDEGNSITTDAAGNVYTTGYFSGTADFDPGTGTTNLTSAGIYDIFIQKLDPAGNLLWVKKMGGTSNDYGSSITTDATGNVYTIGTFRYIVDFDPGDGTTNLISAGYSDIFIQKLDSAGNFLWAKQMGGTSHDYGSSITTDATGNVYTTGYFSGTADFDPGTGTTNLTSAGRDDIFIQKLDPAGNLLWVKKMGGTSHDDGYSITTDVAGNVYTTGSFIGTADFDPGAGTTNLTSAGYYDIFIQKLDSAGNLLWAKQMGGTDYDVGHSITTDATGNVYTTGQFKETVDFDPGTGTSNLTSAGYYDIFIQKLDSAG
ncbi:MAG: SBBP repeat-containing protein, partial [Bacteroidota bacterium]|nr:SBBP repeat-containing protein [Bacteroidota bacterium]